MSAKHLSLNAVAAVALRDAFTHPPYWLPALLLLAPALVLQPCLRRDRSRTLRDEIQLNRVAALASASFSRGLAVVSDR